MNQQNWVFQASLIFQQSFLDALNNLQYIDHYDPQIMH